MKTLLMFLSVAILSGCGLLAERNDYYLISVDGGVRVPVTQQKMVEQIKTLKEEVKLLKQENQRFRETLNDYRKENDCARCNLVISKHFAPLFFI